MKSPRPKYKVLFINTLLDDLGGAEKNFCELVLNIDHNRFAPFVIVFKGGILSEHLTAQGIPTQVNQVSKLLSFHAFRKGLEAYRFMKKEKIDVVVTYHHDADIWGSITARMAGVPVIISNRRDMGYQLQNKHLWFYRFFQILFHAFITVSDAVKKEIVKREWIRPEKVKTIYNGIIPSLYEEDIDVPSIKNDIGIDPSKVIIGSVASFRPVKGQLYLVEAIRELAKNHRNIQMVFVGDTRDDYFRQVSGKIDEWNLNEMFVFAGVRNDVPRVLSAFDIFVISSESEGFSNAILEAMAAGKPVIAPDIGGNPEAVEHLRTGLLFVPCSSRSLAEMLEKLVVDRNLRESMGYHGKCKIKKEFSRNDMIRNYEEFFSQLLRKRHENSRETVSA